MESRTGGNVQNFGKHPEGTKYGVFSINPKDVRIQRRVNDRSKHGG
jgi:hypothetical protein